MYTTQTLKKPLLRTDCTRTGLYVHIESNSPAKSEPHTLTRIREVETDSKIHIATYGL